METLVEFYARYWSIEELLKRDIKKIRTLMMRDDVKRYSFVFPSRYVEFGQQIGETLRGQGLVVNIGKAVSQMCAKEEERLYVDVSWEYM